MLFLRLAVTSIRSYRVLLFYYQVGLIFMWMIGCVSAPFIQLWYKKSRLPKCFSCILIKWVTQLCVFKSTQRSFWSALQYTSSLMVYLLRSELEPLKTRCYANTLPNADNIQIPPEGFTPDVYYSSIKTLDILNTNYSRKASKSISITPHGTVSASAFLFSCAHRLTHPHLAFQVPALGRCPDSTRFAGELVRPSCSVGLEPGSNRE